MNDYVKGLGIGSKEVVLRSSQDLWQIVYDNLQKYFVVGMCVSIVRMCGDKLLTWPEADWLRKEIMKDEFWASECEEGAMCFWTPGDIEKRYEYLKLKLKKFD